VYELDYLSQQPTPDLSGDLEQIINAIAPNFFYMTRMFLVNEIYLGIAKLLDQAQQGQNTNLTLETVITSFTTDNSPQRGCAMARLNEVKNRFSQAAAVRNKLIAHIDYNAALNYKTTIDSMPVSMDALQSIIYDIGLIIMKISPNNTLPTILPKRDDKWLGIKAVIDCLRQTVTS
jgi:hypothetical protein